MAVVIDAAHHGLTAVSVRCDDYNSAQLALGDTRLSLGSQSENARRFQEGRCGHPENYKQWLPQVVASGVNHCFHNQYRSLKQVEKA